MKTFIICGYGIPEDIRKDQNYLTYLHVAFNRIYVEAKNKPACIIPCGGATSCTPPYTRTEAGVMAEYLEELMSRDIMNGATKAWEMVLEEASLSSLENFMFVKRLLGNEEAAVIAFCEATRTQKDQEIADAVFGKGRVRVEGVDFDISKNRYLPDELIEKKEAAARERLLWALESEENLAKQHAFFEERIRKLRQWQNEGMSHIDAVEKWTKEGYAIFEEMIKNDSAQ